MPGVSGENPQALARAGTTGYWRWSGAAYRAALRTPIIDLALSAYCRGSGKASAGTSPAFLEICWLRTRLLAG